MKGGTFDCLLEQKKNQKRLKDVSEYMRQPSERRRWLTGVGEHVGDTRVSSQSWFSVAGFYCVLCDTRVLLATSLPFALMVKWTPPLPFSHSRARSHFLPFYNRFDSCKAAATGYSMVTDYFQGERLFDQKPVDSVFSPQTDLHSGAGWKRLTQTRVHVAKEAIFS